MELQPSSHVSFKIGAALVIGLVAGAVGGYYLGYDVGYEKAVTDTNNAVGVAEDPSSASALEGVETNPLENVKINPFE